MTTTIKYAAELSHVRDVSLLGTANLAYWKDRLAEEDLIPADADGKAQILIVAAEAKFMGVRFRELSFSVLVSPPEDGKPQAAAFLVQAFNSCRFFAFCERVFFSTPYYYGAVGVSTALPASIRLTQHGEARFAAEMEANTSTREPLRVGEDGWEGPVFLPARGRGSARHRKLFFARISGHTRTYPFLPSADPLTIQPARGSEILQELIDSQFVGQEWAVREDAEHAKSKTYKRSDVFSDFA
jgi:hypothetical protein